MGPGAVDSYHFTNQNPTHTVPFSAADFFRDAPWLNIPEGRRASILVESLYPPGHLLGGSSTLSSGPPKSKLAALAAARRKENRKLEVDSATTNSVHLLDRLNDKGDNTRRTELSQKSVIEEITKPTTNKLGTRKYPIRQSEKSSAPPAKAESIQSHLPVKEDEEIKIAHVKRAPTASPSIFATAMFGPVTGVPVVSSYCSRYLKALEKEPLTNPDAFTGPSPDDIVLKAQNASKGSK